MEEIQGTENNAGGCINCGHPVIVKGYPNALCESCRNNYIKFPIPKGIKIFAIGIGLIFLFSIYKIPTTHPRDTQPPLIFPTNRLICGIAPSFWSKNACILRGSILPNLKPL